MGYKTLEITLISASSLKKVNLIGKMDVYVVVLMSNDSRSKQKTPIYKDGDTTPYWNYTVRFTVDEATMGKSGEMVIFQLKHKRIIGSGKEIGEVRVPVKDLMDKKDGDHILTYQVRTPSGKPHGELKFSYEIKDFVAYQPPPQTAYPATAYPAPPPTAYPPPPATAYPPPPPTYGRYAPGLQQPSGFGGYGYGYPQSGGGGYGYPRRNGGFGMGLGAGLLGGALGGMLIGDMVSDYGYNDGCYDDGYYDGGGDFDMDY